MSSFSETEEGTVSNLVRQFRAGASASETMDVRVRRRARFFMPYALFLSLRRIHSLSLEMAARILETMEDDEHKFFMSYGKLNGKNLPDIDSIKGEIVVYAAFLRALDLQDAQFHGNRPGHVSVPADLAIALGRMLQYNDDLLDLIRSGLLDTDYLQIFADAKAHGMAYAGKKALAEIATLAQAAKIVSGKAEDPRAVAPDSWPVFTYKNHLE